MSNDKRKKIKYKGIERVGNIEVVGIPQSVRKFLHLDEEGGEWVVLSMAIPESEPKKETETTKDFETLKDSDVVENMFTESEWADALKEADRRLEQERSPKHCLTIGDIPERQYREHYADIYLLERVNVSLHKCWLVGWIFKEDVLKGGRLQKEESTYVVVNNTNDFVYVIEYEKLQPMALLKERYYIPHPDSFKKANSYRGVSFY